MNTNKNEFIEEKDPLRLGSFDGVVDSEVSLANRRNQGLKNSERDLWCGRVTIRVLLSRSSLSSILWNGSLHGSNSVCILST